MSYEETGICACVWPGGPTIDLFGPARVVPASLFPRQANGDWDGVCACGKIQKDGIRCRLGATHRPPAPPLPWTAAPCPVEVPPVRENKACFPWEPKS